MGVQCVAVTSCLADWPEAEPEASMDAAVGVLDLPAGLCLAASPEACGGEAVC
jgi:hypothetical protein